MGHVLVAVVDAAQSCRATWSCGLGMGGGGGMGARPARVMTLRMASGVVAISTSRSGCEQRGHVVASTRKVRLSRYAQG